MPLVQAVELGCPGVVEQQQLVAGDVAEAGRRLLGVVDLGPGLPDPTETRSELPAGAPFNPEPCSAR